MVPKATEIRFDRKTRRQLEGWLRASTTEQRMVRRAGIILSPSSTSAASKDAVLVNSNSGTSLTLLLVRDDDLTIARVHHEDGKQLCWFSGAGILADLMMIAWLLRPALTGLICTLGLIIHFAAYRPLKYARIDEGRSRVTMRRRSGTGCVLDQDGAQALAWDIRQSVVSD